MDLVGLNKLKFHYKMDWATKRQLQYIGFIFLFVLFFFVIPFFIFIYKAPTCFDGIKNGKETGIDCGGSCRLLCSAEIPEPISRWDPRVFRVTPGVYSVLSYFENPNVAAEVYSAPYSFELYDKDGILVAERKGETFIPRGQIFAIFESNIRTGERVPTRAIFRFTDSLQWIRNTEEIPSVTIVNSPLISEDTSPRLEATVSNNNLDQVRNIDLTAIIFDGAGNAIGASRTFLASLERGQNERVVFTWPLPFETKAEVCESPVDVMVAIDRSGSMAALGANPPQPLTDVKNAAIYFVNQLDENDRVGMVSFATSADTSSESLLSSNTELVKGAIDKIAIGTQGIQQTNITDALSKSLEELSSPRKREGVPSVTVLLTDGVATVPQKPGEPDYPESSALSLGQLIKDRGIRLFTIGLGKDLNQGFLTSLASSPDDFYLAPTTKELNNIYTQIATKICQKRPAVIEIIPRIFPRPITL